MELSNRQMVSTKKSVIVENLELISMKMVNGAKKLVEIQTLNVSNSFIPSLVSPHQNVGSILEQGLCASFPTLSPKNSELVPGMQQVLCKYLLIVKIKRKYKTTITRSVSVKLKKIDMKDILETKISNIWWLIKYKKIGGKKFSNITTNKISFSKL